jgi:hypothetical protein
VNKVSRQKPRARTTSRLRVVCILFRSPGQAVNHSTLSSGAKKSCVILGIVVYACAKKYGAVERKERCRKPNRKKPTRPQFADRIGHGRLLFWKNARVCVSMVGSSCHWTRHQQKESVKGSCSIPGIWVTNLAKSTFVIVMTSKAVG